MSSKDTACDSSASVHGVCHFQHWCLDLRPQCHCSNIKKQSPELRAASRAEGWLSISLLPLLGSLVGSLNF